jgi:hypothetical protein
VKDRNRRWLAREQEALREKACLRSHVLCGSIQSALAENPTYCMELATFEKTVFEFEPISRIVPTTMMRITATMTAYSAIS